MSIENAKIVVVDDFDVVADTMADLLEFSISRPVEKFYNPLEACSYILDNDVDIVISDIDMPQMNGFDLFKKIKQAKPNIIFIFMSGNHSNEKQAKELKADAFIKKPVTLTTINKLVEDFIV